MTTPWAQAEKLAIREMGEVGDGMPVAEDVGREGPLEASPGPALLGEGIVGDKFRVVLVDEIVFEGRQEGAGRGQE